MFDKPLHQRLIEREIESAFRELNHLGVDSKEYGIVMDRIVTWNTLLEKEKPTRVSRNTLALIGANLLGIVLVITHEHVGNVITTRAFNLLTRPM